MIADSSEATHDFWQRLMTSHIFSKKADSPEEALGFPNIVGLLLGVPLTADCVVEEAYPGVAEEAKSDCAQESENSGQVHCCERCCCRCFSYINLKIQFMALFKSESFLPCT